ncbi:hypothetical protein PV08_02530 [Exophiala spinifera]|uniref:Amine oxidase n=1 Tax=Exophiala spinifera TaxID=91928 RepID=A0A0D1ZZS6_9EURO|nr:uncharacterized protein PV08_02530 [Exophiala spinifera]KIW18242.1 hypothetical protein PV08_02530 [Exophiala spinifera]
MALAPSYINPPNVASPAGYSHVGVGPDGGRYVTIAGQIGQDASGVTDPAYEKQVAQAFANLRACLAAVGATSNDVTKLNYYIVDYAPSKLTAIGDGLKATFALDRLPPCTLVPVSALSSPEYLFEVDATALVPGHTTPDNVADVVVVGAGLSGLETARKVQAAGLSCLVLEAMDRVGGKTLSVQSGPGRTTINDLGAAWINDSNQSEVSRLFERFHLEGELQRTTGNSIHQAQDGTTTTAPYGDSLLSEEVASALAELLPVWSQLIEEHSLQDLKASPQAKRLDSVSFAHYCEKELNLPAVLGVANQITRALLGVEAHEISMLFLTDYIKSATGLSNIFSDKKDGGQYMRCKTGMQSICHAMSKELVPGSVHLNTPVAEIEQSASGCTVRSASGAVFRSKKVVVSLPTTLYPTLTFSPPLPAEKQALAENSILGYYSKIVFVWDKPWWREQGFSGVLQSSCDPISFARDTSIDVDRQWSITCFMVGDPGRKWSQQSKQVRQKSVWDQLRAAYENAGAQVPEPANVLEIEWSKQQYFQGAPSAVYGLNDLITLGSALRTPFKSVHFVGTETSLVWKGYMEGAIRSGQRGAAEVVASLVPAA